MEQAQKKGDHCIHYKIKKWKIEDNFEILNNISEYVTLVQFMDTVGKVNHSVSIDGNWISDSNDEKKLPLEK